MQGIKELNNIKRSVFITDYALWPHAGEYPGKDRRRGMKAGRQFVRIAFYLVADTPFHTFFEDDYRQAEQV